MSSAGAEVIVIGAGIVGLSTARALLSARPGLRLLVIEKEPVIAAHQSSHNSGVIHSGIYYRPGSEKARTVAAGREALLEFADRHEIVYELCGKVVVATSPRELDALAELRRRAKANGVRANLVGRRELADLEPHCEGLAALHVPSTGIIDFARVCEALAAEIEGAGGKILLGEEVRRLTEREQAVLVETAPSGEARETRERDARVVVNCAGLHADRVAASGPAGPPPFRIMPFRGEYLELVPSRRFLVRNLIYPVPDPRFPFLGVHATRGIDGCVHLGPNAVPALAREGYTRSVVDRAELFELIRRPEVRHLARRYWRTELAELFRSFWMPAFVKAVQALLPEVGARDLVKAGTGVRAQAVSPDGTLVDDFAFAETPRVVNVLNAPSPAATASLEIGRSIATRVLERVTS